MRACMSVCVWKNTEKPKEQPEQCAVFVFVEELQKTEQCADVLLCIVGIVCCGGCVLCMLCAVYVLCCAIFAVKV